MKPNPYLTMALNNAWANATLYKAITTMSEAEFTAPRPGFFPSLCLTMNHIYEVDLYYIDALEAGGLGRSVYDRKDIADVAALAAVQCVADLRFAGFCGALEPSSLSQLCRTERADCVVEERTDALIMHLVQHQIHHRGQAHTMVADAGIDPPQLDDFHLEYGRVPSARAYFG